MGKEFLGRGWKFPVELDSADRVVYEKEETKIQQSVLIILGTARGERVMRPEFGSRLNELVFAPINSATKSLVSHYTIEALVPAYLVRFRKKVQFEVGRNTALEGPTLRPPESVGAGTHLEAGRGAGPAVGKRPT